MEYFFDYINTLILLGFYASIIYFLIFPDFRRSVILIILYMKDKILLVLNGIRRHLTAAISRHLTPDVQKKILNGVWTLVVASRGLILANRILSIMYWGHTSYYQDEVDEIDHYFWILAYLTMVLHLIYFGLLILWVRNPKK